MTLLATCTPNSLPAAGHVEHGFQINVLNDDMAILATINLPDWQTFRPASAGHRLIEHGYMIDPAARGPETVNGWRPVGLGWMVPVIRTDDDQGDSVNAVFGERWDAPMACPDVPQIETPVGEPCGWCRIPIEGGDRGLMIPCLTTREVQLIPWHRECLLRSTLGCPAHIRGEGTCSNGHNGAVSAPQTPEEMRAEAMEVWAMMGGPE